MSHHDAVLKEDIKTAMETIRSLKELAGVSLPAQRTAGREEHPAAFTSTASSQPSAGYHAHHHHHHHHHHHPHLSSTSSRSPSPSPPISDPNLIMRGESQVRRTEFEGRGGGRRGSGSTQLRPANDFGGFYEGSRSGYRTNGQNLQHFEQPQNRRMQDPRSPNYTAQLERAMDAFMQPISAEGSDRDSTVRPPQMPPQLQPASHTIFQTEVRAELPIGSLQDRYSDQTQTHGVLLGLPSEVQSDRERSPTSPRMGTYTRNLDLREAGKAKRKAKPVVSAVAGVRREVELTAHLEHLSALDPFARVGGGGGGGGGGGLSVGGARPKKKQLAQEMQLALSRHQERGNAIVDVCRLTTRRDEV